jgi:hypothetical protein
LVRSGFLSTTTWNSSGAKKGRPGVLQVQRAVGDGVAQLHAAVGREADDVARVGLVDRLAPLREEGDHRRRPQFLGGALHLQLHAGRVLARGHAHEGDAVAVRGVHVGLHLEHDAGEGGVVGATMRSCGCG